MSDLPSGTVTFLFTDIEGSTKLLEQLRDEYVTVLADQRECLRTAFAQWNGHEVDTQGDAFFVAFPRALDAIGCVVQAQRALTQHSWPRGTVVRVRMGLHTGEPILARTGYVSMEVHRAARIAAAGYGGQVLVSDTVRALCENDLPAGVTLRDLGLHKLKDFRSPIPIYQLEIQGLASEFPPLKTLDRGEEPPAAGESPFQGLEFFDEADADRFFGREAVTAALVTQVQRERFLAIVGASGSGKSSLARAGLVPALKGGFQANGGHWRVYVLAPTAHPLEMLATVLTRDEESVTATSTLMDDLVQDARSLHLYLKRCTRGGEHLLLLIDQFEELFTLCRDENERSSFVGNLLYAVHAADGPTTLLLTLRADFYAALAPYPDLRTLVAKHQEYIGPMTRAELRRAIQEPAERGGWEYGPGLVDLILDEVGEEPGALPLLSHALLETWKRRRGNVMTLKSYGEAGGVRGAIAKSADRVYNRELSPPQREIARSMFLRLTALGEGTQDTRRRAPLTELIPRAPYENAQQAEQVLKQLADARLITTEEGSAQVAHEALIREWPQLREWLTQDRDSLRLHRHLTEAAEEWELLERDAGALYRGARLGQLREWAQAHPAEMNELELAFLQASEEAELQGIREREQQQERELAAAKQIAQAAQELAEVESQRAEQAAAANRKLKRRALILMGVVLLAVLLAAAAGFFGIQSRNNAAQAQQNLLAADTARADALAQRDVAQKAEADALGQQEIARSGELAALSLGQLEVDPERALLIARDAVNTAQTAQAEDALRAALRDPFRLTFKGRRYPILGAEITPDEKYVVTHEECANPGAGQDFGKCGSFRVWDARSGALISDLDTPPAHKMSFSSDGKHLVTANDDAVARVWEIPSGKMVSELRGHHGTINDIGFSPDGSRVLTASNDKTVRVWDAETGKVVHELRDYKAPLASAKFSPDGSKIFASTEIFVVDENAGDEDEWAEQKVLSDAKTGAPLIDIPDAFGYYAEFSPDSRFVALWGEGIVTTVWSVASGTKIAELGDMSARTRSLAYSPDSKNILLGKEDGTLRLYDALTGFSKATLLAHGRGVTDARFSDDGKFIISAGGDSRARLWQFDSDITGTGGGSFEDDQMPQDAMLESLLELHGHTGTINTVRFSPDGQSIITASDDGTARLWRVNAGTALEGHTNFVNRVTFSPDGKRVATASGDGTTRLWDVATHKTLLTLPNPSDARRTLAFSADGENLLTVNDDGRVQVWNVETGKRNWELDDSTLGIFHAAFTPDSQRVATFGQDDKLRIWHAATGEKIAERLLHGSDTPDNLVAQNTYLAFSPDGTEGAVSIGKYGIRRFDVHTGEALPTLSGALFYFSMAYSPDGRRLAVTYSNAASPTVGISADGGLQVWDTSTRKLVYDARGPFGSSIPFSLDGKYILTTHQDETARVWDANTGKLLHELKGHTAEINRAAFSPDGRFILTASSDASARVWEVATGKLVEILRGHSGIVTDASFSPDGKTIITTGDNTARLYECVACAPLDDLLAIANARITRELSCEERVTFLRETLECE